MKSMILAACLVFSASLAYGSNMQAIDSLKTVELAANQFEATYEIGGGCAEHQGVVRVFLEKDTAPKSYKARVAIYDVANAEDACEAKLTVAVQADLNELIKQEAARQNIKVEDLDIVKIELPSVTADAL